MASFNRLLLLGNLTRDPESRTAGGTAICKFALGVNRKFTDAQGRPQTETTFVDCVAFGKQAETLGKFLTKGKPLFVEGRLKLEQWEKDGAKYSRLVCIVEGFQFIDGGHPTTRPGPGSGPSRQEDYHGTGD